MNIETAVMKVPYFEAQQQFQAYRALVKERPQHATKDDVSLYRALWQITRGQKVIDIQQAIAFGGFNEAGLPKLAIGKADKPYVHCWRDEARFVFTSQPRSWSFSGRRHQLRSALTVRSQNGNREDVTGRAQTPIVPAKHRPNGALAGYHLLWEAEWQPLPPVDPILLRHIDGPFYVALAQWDLTPLEQAVLRAKL